MNSRQRAPERKRMDRFPCEGYQKLRFNRQNNMLNVNVYHETWHPSFVSVALAAEAETYIRSHAGSLNPAALTNSVKLIWPGSTAARVHQVWLEAFRHKWVRDSSDSMLPATNLFAEMPDDAKLLPLPGLRGGAVAIAWGLSGICQKLREVQRPVVEVGVHATYKATRFQPAQKVLDVCMYYRQH